MKMSAILSRVTSSPEVEEKVCRAWAFSVAHVSNVNDAPNQRNISDSTTSTDSETDIKSYRDDFASENGDVEAQSPDRSMAAEPEKTSVGIEYTVSLHKKLAALSFYFFLSLGLTIQSKMLLGKVRTLDLPAIEGTISDSDLSSRSHTSSPHSTQAQLRSAAMSSCYEAILNQQDWERGRI